MIASAIIVSAIKEQDMAAYDPATFDPRSAIPGLVARLAHGLAGRAG
jgi:hypothetical protein